jgi:hypothetical protein
MKLHSPGFEQRLLAAWRRARKRRPRINRRFWTRHRSLPFPVSCAMLGALVGALVGAGLASLRAHGWNRPGVEGFAAFALTGLLVLFAPGMQRRVLFPPELGALLWLPIAEEEIFRWAWGRVSEVWVTAFGLLAGLFAVVLLPYESDWASAGLLLALAALASAPLASFMLLPVRRLLIQVFLAMVLVYGSAVFCVPGVEPLLRGLFNQYGPVLNWLHPGGWVVGVWQGWREPAVQPLGLSIALPLFALAAALRYSRRRHRTNFQTSRMLPAIEGAGRFRSRSPSQGSAEPASKLVEPTQARVDFLEAWRAPAAPLASDFVGRLVERRLNVRERLLVSATKGSLPRYLRMSWTLWRLLAGLIAAAFLFRLVSPAGNGFWLLHFGAFYCLLIHLAVASSFPVLQCVAAGLPIGYREVARLRLRIARPALLMSVFPCMAFGAAAAYLYSRPWREGVFAGVKVVLALYAIFPVGTVLAFSAGSDDTQRWRWHSIVTWPAVFGAVLTSFCGLSAIVVGNWPAWPIMLIIAALGSRAFVAWHRLVWARGWIDLAVASRHVS